LDDARTATILEELRRSTRSDHERLENSLDLLARPADREYFIAVLRSFLSFHQVYEPAVFRHAELASFMPARSRIPHIRADLSDLGVDLDLDDVTPICLGAETCGRSVSEAWGAAYVIEGSTLGGQVITRNLAGTKWLPPGGLRTFHPYGHETGRMWNEFRTRLVTASTSLDAPLIVAGAVHTFSLLADWLPTRSSYARSHP
jgi:heme oxygenase